MRQAFGLRSQESLLSVDVTTKPDGSQTLRVTGCKGGRDRDVPIRTDQQRETINRVQQHVRDNGQKTLIPNNLLLEQGYDAQANALSDVGAVKKDSTNAHAARHNYAQERIKEGADRLTVAADTAQATRKREVKKQVKKTTDTTFSELASKYLDWSEKRHVSKTYEHKAMICRKFLAHSGDIAVTGKFYGEKALSNIIEYYLNTRPSNHNFNIHRKELRAVFNYGITKGITPAPNPVNNIDKLPEDQTVAYIPPQEDIVKAILAAGVDRPLLMVLLHTLARISEILGMRWRDVSFSQGSVRLWTRKRKGGGLEYDDLPMNEALKEVLQSLWEERKQEEWVFFNEDTGTRYNRRPKFMAGICKRAGVKPFGFHSIRHFAASFLADKDKISMKAISGLLRHKSLNTTERYLHHISGSQKTL